MTITNPFTGEQITARKITRRHHDLHPDKFTDFVFDTDKGADSNEYYQLLVNTSDQTFLLIKEPEKDYKF
jgi:hypothetical protein